MGREGGIPKSWPPIPWECPDLRRDPRGHPGTQGDSEGQGTQPGVPCPVPPTRWGQLGPPSSGFPCFPTALGRAPASLVPTACPSSPCHPGLPAYSLYAQLGPGLAEEERGALVPAPQRPQLPCWGGQGCSPWPWLARRDSSSWGPERTERMEGQPPSCSVPAPVQGH